MLVLEGTESLKDCVSSLLGHGLTEKSLPLTYPDRRIFFNRERLPIEKQKLVSILSQEKAEFADIKFDDGEFDFFLENLANNTVIKRIKFFSKVFSEQQIIEFSRVLETNKTIESLEIYEYFSPENTEAISNMLKKNNHLKKIALRCDNHRGIALAEALKTNESLQVLDLSCAKIGDEGGKALAEALEYNTGLRELNLKYNKMTLDVLKYFCRAFRSNNTLEELKVFSPNIKITGNVLSILQDPECEYNTLPPYGMMTKKAYSLPSKDDANSTTEQSAPKDDDTIPTTLQDTLLEANEVHAVGEASTPEETSEGSIL